MYISENINIKLISRYYDDILAVDLRINKTSELIFQKYYWPSIKANIKAYQKEYNIWLALKIVKHKLYEDLKSLPVLIYQLKISFMDFFISLLVFIN